MTIVGSIPFCVGNPESIYTASATRYSVLNFMREVVG